MTASKYAGLAVVGACLAVLVTGCAMTRQTRSVEPRGFLKDYGQLQEGGKGQAKLVYLNPRAAWSKYDKILLDPVTLWVEGNESLASVPEEEQQLLADYLDEALRTALKEDYALVDRDGPGTMHLRVAVTEAKGSRVVANTVSKIVPQLRLLTTVGGLASGTQVLVGRVGIEAEILDSITEERLGAAVDRRAGTKALRSGVSKWSDVQRACDHWATQLRDRLRELRGSGG